MKWAVWLAFALEATALNFVKSTTKKPKYRETAKRVSYLYGPFQLMGKDQKKPKGAGISMDPKGQGGMTTLSGGLPKQATILAAHWALKYQNGEEATPKNDVYIHHFVSFDTEKKTTSPFQDACGKGLGGLGGATFADRGEDSGVTDTVFTSADGKFNSGFHFGTAPKLRVQYDLVNYSNQNKNLYMELTLEYVPGVQGLEAGATLKSVGGCGLGKINLNGATNSGTITVKQPSVIVWARGNLHSGGTSMQMKINNKVVCTSKPTYDSNGVITLMSLCPTPINLKTGDKIVITSFYDTRAHPLRKATDGSGHGAHTKIGGSDVMGMMAMTYALKK